MSGKIQTRLALLVALAALVAVVVPATLALGSHSGDSPTTVGEPSVVYLTLGKQDNIQWDGLVQPISTRKNDCTAVALAASPQVLTVTPDGGVLGEVKDGLGVKSASDGSGEPCGRVEGDDDEEIAVSLGSALAGYLMTTIDVDLELKFNAVVDIIFYHEGVEVDRVSGWTGTGGSDDGPDSGDGDNFRFNSADNNVEDITDAYFDTVVFDPTSGAISLEGGADGTEPGALGVDDPYSSTLQVDESRSSQFEVIRGFDGQITCGDEEPIGDGGLTSGLVTMHSEDKGDGWLLDPLCDLKPYDAWTTLDSLAFVPELEGTNARYTIEVTVQEQAIIVDSEGTITSLIATYDPDPALTFPDVSADLALKACLSTPVLADNPATEGVNEYDDFWTQADVGLLPDGEDSACWYHASVEPTGAGEGTETWGIYFEDDPGFGFK